MRICRVSRSCWRTCSSLIVARAVDFASHVERPAFKQAISIQQGSRIVKINLGSAGAVQAFGKNAGDGCLAGAARAAEQIGVGDALLPDGVGQRLRDVFLPDNVGEPLRPVLPGNDLV